jgi:DNA recombination protein RmuC
MLTLSQLGTDQGEKLIHFSAQIKALTESNQAHMDNIRKAIDSRIKEMQAGNEKKLDEMRETESKHLEGVSKKLKELTDSNELRITRLGEAIERQLKSLQEGNEKKLEQMRVVVDEKLQSTLEKRLGESFKLVSERLEAVQQGLGEMRNLATGVGDLKRVLTNVKTRGTWGEVQLGALLEQILTPDQFERNVQTKDDSREVVEYAVCLPGPDKDKDSKVWLPIDAKFPQEDYLRLVEASENGDAAAVQTAMTALIRSIQSSAKDISTKYLNPPKTTDFAILFLPTEGLYAETLRQPGLIERLQNDHRVVVAGPTTLAAILNSLRMGFRTLAIEQRSSEVWKVLASVKSEFGKFGGVLDKVKKQLETASRTIDETHVRSRAIERRLRSVEDLPAGESAPLIGGSGQSDADEETPEDE